MKDFFGVTLISFVLLFVITALAAIPLLVFYFIGVALSIPIWVVPVFLLILAALLSLGVKVF